MSQDSCIQSSFTPFIRCLYYFLGLYCMISIIFIFLIEVQQVSWGTAQRPAFGLGVDVKVEAGKTWRCLTVQLVDSDRWRLWIWPLGSPKPPWSKR